SPLAASAYTPNSSYLWTDTNGIPNQFRTTLTVQVGPTGVSGTINQLLYADETAGSRLRLIDGGWLYSEYMLLTKGAPQQDQNGYVPLTLTVSHPYAATAAAPYLTEALTYNVHLSVFLAQIATSYFSQVLIVQGWGNASESTVAHFSALVQRDQTHT